MSTPSIFNQFTPPGVPKFFRQFRSRRGTSIIESWHRFVRRRCPNLASCSLLTAHALIMDCAHDWNEARRASKIHPGTPACILEALWASFPESTGNHSAYTDGSRPPKPVAAASSTVVWGGNGSTRTAPGVSKEVTHHLHTTSKVRPMRFYKV